MGVPVVRRYDMIHRWLADGTISEAQLMAADGLHMADEGYERLAAEVARELMAAAKPQPPIDPPPATVKTAAR
jgi:lysophospholipase L1-like esterase